MVLGGVVGLAGDLGQQWINIYSAAVGLAMFTMEWARGARKQGRTMGRTYQEHITPFLGKPFRTSVWNASRELSLALSLARPPPRRSRRALTSVGLEVAAKFGLLWSNLFVRGILHLGYAGSFLFARSLPHPTFF